MTIVHMSKRKRKVYGCVQKFPNEKLRVRRKTEVSKQISKQVICN